MKKVIALAVLSLALVGCTYSLDEIDASKAACAKKQGKFDTELDTKGFVYLTYCEIDGIQYTYIRSTDNFAQAQAK